MVCVWVFLREAGATGLLVVVVAAAAVVVLSFCTHQRLLGRALHERRGVNVDNNAADGLGGLDDQLLVLLHLVPAERSDATHGRTNAASTHAMYTTHKDTRAGNQDVSAHRIDHTCGRARRTLRETQADPRSSTSI
jgi:hypothetical protein